MEEVKNSLRNHTERTRKNTTGEFPALTFLLHIRSPGRAREGATIPPADPRSRQMRRRSRSSRSPVVWWEARFLARGSGSRWGREGEGRKRRGDEEKGKKWELLNFVGLLSIPPPLSLSSSHTAILPGDEIGVRKKSLRKKIKGERRKHQPLTRQRHPVLHQAKGCTINSSSARERRGERRG